MNTLAYFLALLSLLMGGLLFIKIKAPLGFMILPLKLAAASLSPVWAACGVIGLVLGWLYRVPPAMAAGFLGALAMAWYVRRVTRAHNGFAAAFGDGWRQRIAREQAIHMLKRRWNWSLGRGVQSEPQWERNLAFATIPGTDRQLYCDMWRPPTGVRPSGVAFIYFHGSAWSMLDKDFGTRPFFRHLAVQGHVVMDVAYRLCPEVDLHGMIADVKRAISWMKAHAGQYGADPERIVLGEVSAGGHLAMLAAYIPNHPRMTPPDLLQADLSVRGVISYYGPVDLRAVYQHTGQARLVGLPKMDTGALGRKTLPMKDAGRLDVLLGGHPADVPEEYDLASPIMHVHPGGPPVLLIQGEHDLITPVGATRAMYRKLTEMGVPVINVVFPCTEHAFDLLLPTLSPVSQSAMYEVDRFLVLV